MNLHHLSLVKGKQAKYGQNSFTNSLYTKPELTNNCPTNMRKTIGNGNGTSNETNQEVRYDPSTKRLIILDNIGNKKTKDTKFKGTL